MDTYKATNTLNGKFYIGSTNDFQKRKRQHLKSDKNYPFQNALRKNPEVFEWECWTDDSDKPILEQAMLDMWFGKEQCYNLNPRADRPSASLDQCRRGGLVALEKHPNQLSNNGKKSGRKTFELGLGLFSLTPDQQAENQKKGGQVLYDRGEGLHSLTPEQHAENGRKGGAVSAKNSAKAVICTETEVTYSSTCEAERETGISRVCISNCCLGKQNTAGKLHWKFVEVRP
jgi:general stress protein YciG